MLVERSILPTLRAGCTTLLFLMASGPLSGCMTWDPQRWSFDSLRDERAVEIENRLSRDEPIVQNPFADSDSHDK